MGRQRTWCRVSWLAICCCFTNQSFEGLPARPPVSFLALAVVQRIFLSNHFPHNSASRQCLLLPSIRDSLYRTRALQAPGHNFSGTWTVINKVLTGYLQTTYGNTFVIVLAAIEASLVHVSFYTPNLTPLPKITMADFWGLWGCREQSDGCWPRQAIGNIVDDRNVVFHCYYHPLLKRLEGQARGLSSSL